MDSPKEVVLDNGLKVYMIDAGDEEITRIDVIITAGSAFQSKRLVASSVGRLLKEGTKTYSSSVIANEFDYYGAYFDTSVTKDSSTLTLYSLTKHLEKLLPLVSEMLVDANFQQHELDIHLNRKKQEYLVNREKVRYSAMLEFSSLVFGKHSAYGQTLEESDFDKVKQQDLIEFYTSHYSIQNSYMIVSGRADEKVAGLINRYFGNGLNDRSNHIDRIKFVDVNGQMEKYIAQPEAMQSAIRIGRPMINKMHPDYNRFVLLNTILGGYFGSRLMSNLREDKGYTYGVSSFTLNYINGAAFSIATEVNASHTQAAIDEIYHEMEVLRSEKISGKELQLVKNYIYGTFLRNFDGPFALADRFRSAYDFGLRFDYYLNSLDEILSVNSDELIETANKYLNPDDMIKLVVGKME